MLFSGLMKSASRRTISRGPDSHKKNFDKHPLLWLYRRMILKEANPATNPVLVPLRKQSLAAVKPGSKSVSSSRKQFPAAKKSVASPRK
jgi:hypothetical protein